MKIDYKINDNITNKQFKHYLENKQTQELLKFYQNNTVGRNSGLPYENNKSGRFLKLFII